LFQALVLVLFKTYLLQKKSPSYLPLNGFFISLRVAQFDQASLSLSAALDSLSLHSRHLSPRYFLKTILPAMWKNGVLRVVVLVVVSALSLSDVAFGRMRWAERDGKPVFLHPRRFRLEFPLIIDKIAVACPSAVCGILAGGAIVPLLAFQPECSQQDFADSIISELRLFLTIWGMRL
jgi:hypothetical protein